MASQTRDNNRGACFLNTEIRYLWPGCSCTNKYELVMVYGERYCKSHLSEALRVKLCKCSNILNFPESDKQHFMKILGRYIESTSMINQMEGLSMAKIRDRASLKSFDGCSTVVFEIERHGYFIPRIQTWEVNLNDYKVTKIRELPTYLTTKELAAELGLSIKQIRHRIKTQGIVTVPASELAQKWKAFMIDRKNHHIASSTFKATRFAGTSPNAILVSWSDIDKLR